MIRFCLARCHGYFDNYVDYEIYLKIIHFNSFLCMEVIFSVMFRTDTRNICLFYRKQYKIEFFVQYNQALTMLNDQYNLK